MMKCSYSEQAFKWQNDDGSYGVGKLVIDEYSNVISQFGGAILPGNCLGVARVLIADSYTRDLEFVESGKLIPYGPPGGDEMPQPEKTK
jgi:hypothetical protein